jgi:Ca2+ regulator and membrane fusion protein Fig1
VKPFPSRPVSWVVAVTLALASFLQFVSILWQHISSSAAAVTGQSLSYGTIKGHVGAVAMVLGWGGVFLNILVTVMVLIMILSIATLDRLQDD